MKITQKISHNGISPSECFRIPHMIYEADFNTNYPIPNRIDRIAREIDEYMRWKRKCDKGVKQYK